MALVHLLSGCSNDKLSEREEAADIINAAGCGSCHTIPGIARANARVGPKLNNYGEHTYIAGILPNNESNLVLWLTAPHEVHRQSAMPDLGLSESEATAIARYLYNETQAQ